MTANQALKSNISYEIDVLPLKHASCRPFHLEKRMKTKRSDRASPDVAESKRQLILDARRQRLISRMNKIKSSVEKQNMSFDDSRTKLRLSLDEGLANAETKRKEYILEKKHKSLAHVEQVKAVVAKHREEQLAAQRDLQMQLEERLNAKCFRRQLIQNIPRSKIMSEAHVLAELNRTKFAARVIQRCWRLRSVTKTTTQLSQAKFAETFDFFSVKNMSMEQLMSTVQNPEFVKYYDTVLLSVKACDIDLAKKRMKHMTKIFLSSYMIAYHTAEIMPTFGSYEENVKEAAISALHALESLVSDSTWANVKKFLASWIVFNDMFQEWKAKDTREMLDILYEHFIQLEQLWLSVKDQVDASHEWKPRIDLQQKNIKSKILRVGGKNALQKLNELTIAFRKENGVMDDANSQSGSELPENEVSKNVSESVATSSYENPYKKNSTEKDPDLNEALRGFSQMMTNEQLAHELIMDPDFQLQTNDQSLEAQVRTMTRKAFFDQLRERPNDLNWVPDIVADVREQLLSMTKENSTFYREIADGLDPSLIAQQLSHGVADLRSLIKFVCEKMLQLCAPVRDASIREVLELSEAPSAFEQIVLIAEGMKLDLANYRLKMIRPHLMKQAVDYERSKFERTVGKGISALKNSNEWLQEAAQKMKDIALQRNPQNVDIPENKVRFDAVYFDALLSLIFMPEALDVNTVPETLQMDVQRLFMFQNEVQAVTIVASLLMLSRNFFPEVRELRIFEDLKQKLFILLRDSDTTIDNLAAMIIDAAEKAMNGSGKVLADDKRELIRKMVDKTLSYKDTVYLLLNRRIRDSIRFHLVSGRFRKDSNNGLDPVQEELEALSRKIFVLAQHNRNVYAPWYDKIIGGVLDL